MTDQFHHWRLALQGNRIETERGSPRSGFFKRTTNKPEPQHIEAVCIYRDETGALQCIRNVFGDGSKMTDAEIDDLFGEVCAYPITEELFRGVTEHGEAWPAEYGTKGRLSLKDQQAGVAWTPEYARRRMGLADNPRAVIGGNQPPEETPPEAPAADPAPGHTFGGGEKTADVLMVEEVSALGAQVKAFLDRIGGTPRDKAEADTLGDYKTKFGALETKAENARKQEKQPHLDAGRDVDARWKRPITNAGNSKKKCADLANAWMEAENARLQAEADRENREAAERAAAEAGDGFTDPRTPATVQPALVKSVGNMRQVSQRETTVWRVDDPRQYLRHLLSLNSDLPAELVDVLGKVATRRAVEAPGVSSKIERKAA